MSTPCQNHPAWNWNVPAYFNIGVACTDAHLGTPVADRIAMIVEDDNLGTTQITYAQLAARTTKFAQLLRNHGVAAGERVLIRLSNSIDYHTAFLGAMKAGCIAVPTSTLLTAQEVLYLAKDSSAKVIVTDADMWQQLQAGLTEAGTLKLALLSGLEIESSGNAVSLETELAAITTC